jgi:phage shock protein PspC (stress-responsive transcriptional regulator)
LDQGNGRVVPDVRRVSFLDPVLMDTGTATIDPDPNDPDPNESDLNESDVDLTDDEPSSSEQAQDPTRGLPPAFAPPPPPPPKTPWWQVRVARDAENKKVGGVIAGLSRAYGFDVKTTRIAVAIATLIFPAILALYIAAMILLPDRYEDAAPLRDVVTDRKRMPLVIVIGIILVAASVGSFGTWFLFGGFGWGFALIALGVVLWAVPSFTRSAKPATEVADNPPAGAGPLTSSFAPPRAATSPTTPPTPPATPFDTTRAAPQPEVPRRRRFPIAAVAFLVATTVGMVAAIGDALNWWDTNVLGVTITVLIILGVGAIASVAINQFWVAAPFAILFLGLAAVLLVVQPNLNGGIGERRMTPVQASELAGTEQLAIGELTIDLTEVPLGEQPLAVSAEVGIGQLRVIVPDSAVLRVESHLGAGVLTLDDDQLTKGVRQDDTRTIEPSATVEGQTSTIELDLEVGAGVIDIDRSSS